MLIGLTGHKGSGKDSAALQMKGFYRFAFGDAMKHEVAEAFGIDVKVLYDRELKENPHIPLIRCKDPDFYDTAMNSLKPSVEEGPGWKFKRIGIDLLLHLSPRKIMQLWGTEYRRAQDNLYWIRKLHENRVYHEERGKFEAITDVREHHEASYVKRQGGILIRVLRPNNPYDTGDTHGSEVNVNKLAVDFEIINDGTLEDLGAKIEAVIFGAI